LCAKFVYSVFMSELHPVSRTVPRRPLVY
jgi:hypothetical protein